MGLGAKICSQTDFDYHREFYQAKNDAFQESLEESELESLICRNFRKERDNLVPDLSFARFCWSWRYRGVVEKQNINGCKGFRVFGADDNFVANCQEIVGSKLYSFLPSGISRKAERILAKVKRTMSESWKDRSWAGRAEKALDAILDVAPLQRNLHSLKAQLLSPEEYCARGFDEKLCGTFIHSRKLALSLGGYLFLSEDVLENIVAKTLAGHVGRSLNRELEAQRLNVYRRFFEEEMENSRFEELVARIGSEDELNLNVNALVILSDYYSLRRKRNPGLFYVQSGYYCYQDPRQGEVRKLDRSEHYAGDFDRLFRPDQAEMLSCREER